LGAVSWPISTAQGRRTGYRQAAPGMGRWLSRAGYRLATTNAIRTYTASDMNDRRKQPFRCAAATAASSKDCKEEAPRGQRKTEDVLQGRRRSEKFICGRSSKVGTLYAPGFEVIAAITPFGSGRIDQAAFWAVQHQCLALHRVLRPVSPPCAFTNRSAARFHRPGTAASQS